MKALVAVLAGSLVLWAQGWTPKRIVGITVYPPEARERRISGKVAIRCVLSADGSVSRTEVISGHWVFTGQALRNALEWQFERGRSAKDSSTSNEVVLFYEFVLEVTRNQTPPGVNFIFESPAHVLVTTQIPWPEHSR